MKRFFLQIFQPRVVRALDYAASYPSQWVDGGIPVEVLNKKFDKAYLRQLMDAQYLVVEDEPIGLDDLTQKVYSLTPKAYGITRSNKAKNDKKTEDTGFWLMVARGVLITVIATLVLAVIYLLTKEYTGVELPL